VKKWKKKTRKESHITYVHTPLNRFRKSGVLDVALMDVTLGTETRFFYAPRWVDYIPRSLKRRKMARQSAVAVANQRLKSYGTATWPT
jgi:hypothetical protein